MQITDRTLPCWIAGEASQDGATFPITDKATGTEMCRIAVASSQDVSRAIDAAEAARPSMASWPAYERAEALRTIVAGIQGGFDEFSAVLSREAGKPIREATVEVDRTIETLRLASEEATRIGGSVMPIEYSERSKGMEAIWRRVPIGVCSFITPFNFPLNLAAHKIGPAIAAGCPFILKPDPRTPLTTLMLGELLSEAGLPDGSFSLLPTLDNDARSLFVTDERPRLLSFTGSGKVGWALKARAGKKKVVLELGGIAPCIVDAGTDLELASSRIVAGAFGYAGQSCISVQRVIVHEDLASELAELLVAGARQLKRGDLHDPQTTIGPLIEESQAQRVESWVNLAVASGAKLLTGGRRDGNFFEPTLLRNLPAGITLSCEEVFGPVAIIESFTDFKQALHMANATRFGLQAGLFTSSLDHAFAAWRELEFGGVVINNIPTTRIDAMPYGGVKDSGLGREGVRFAIEDMTELRTMVISGLRR